MSSAHCDSKITMHLLKRTMSFFTHFCFCTSMEDSSVLTTLCRSSSMVFISAFRETLVQVPFSQSSRQQHLRSFSLPKNLCIFLWMRLAVFRLTHVWPRVCCTLWAVSTARVFHLVPQSWFDKHSCCIKQMLCVVSRSGVSECHACCTDQWNNTRRVLNYRSETTCAVC